MSTAAASRLCCGHVPRRPPSRGGLAFRCLVDATGRRACLQQTLRVFAPIPSGGAWVPWPHIPPASRTGFSSGDRALRRPTHGSCWHPHFQAGGVISVGTRTSPRGEQSHVRPAGGRRRGTCTFCFVSNGRGWSRTGSLVPLREWGQVSRRSRYRALCSSYHCCSGQVLAVGPRAPQTRVA